MNQKNTLEVKTTKSLTSEYILSPIASNERESIGNKRWVSESDYLKLEKEGWFGMTFKKWFEREFPYSNKHPEIKQIYSVNDVKKAFLAGRREGKKEART